MEISIQNVTFVYDGAVGDRLKKGATGKVKVALQNNGLEDVENISVVLMEPIKIAGLEYKPTLDVPKIGAGEVVNVEIPVKYLENNAKTRGVKKYLGAEDKMRVLVKQPGVGNIDLAEVKLNLGKAPIAGNVNNRFSETEDIDFFFPEPVSRNFLFVIGVNEYQYWTPLNNCVKDAKDVTAILTSEYKFEKEEVFTLFNEEVTQQNIRNELIKIKREISENDNLVLYYAGHGFYDREFDDGSWIPFDARLNEETDYLSNVRLLKYLNALNTKHTFVIADACFSGSLFVSETMKHFEAYNDKKKSRWGLSSGNMEEVADGAKGENSPFAASLIEGLSNSVKSSVSVSELISIVVNRVKSKSKQTPVGKPLKLRGNDGGEFVFYKR